MDCSNTAYPNIRKEHKLAKHQLYFQSLEQFVPRVPNSELHVKSEAQKSSPTASKPAVSELAESVSIPALRDIDQAPSLEHSPIPGVDGGPTGPEGGKSGAQPFLLITS
jgi:hypothetical protein